MMRWNFPTDRSCCSRIFAKASARSCCSFRRKPKKRKPNIQKRDVPLTGCTTRRRADPFPRQDEPAAGALIEQSACRELVAGRRLCPGVASTPLRPEGAAPHMGGPCCLCYGGSNSVPQRLINGTSCVPSIPLRAEPSRLSHRGRWRTSCFGRQRQRCVNGLRGIPMPVGPASDVTPKAMRPPVQKASLIGGFCLMAPWPPRVDSGKPSRED